MPLSLFHLQSKTHLRERNGEADSFGHSFGGDPATYGLQFVRLSRFWQFLGRSKLVRLKKPLHLLYRLNLADPKIPVKLPGISWLPLCYGFGYVEFDGLCIYRVISDTSVELVWPDKPKFNPNFPFPKYPRSFPRKNVCLEKAKYDATNADDALSLAAVFGVDELPPKEMARAVKYVAENTDLMRTWCGEEYGWEPEHVVASMYPRPFAQGAPSGECKNPHCSAEIVNHSNAITVDPAEIWSAEQLQEFKEAGIDPTIRVPSRPVRRDSLRVFALYESEIRNSPVLDDIQLIFQICDACHCITVDNQCG